MKKIREEEAYKKSYPSYLEPSNRIWVLEKGKRVEIDDVVYEIVQIVQPILPGSRPRLALKVVSNESAATEVPSKAPSSSTARAGLSIVPAREEQGFSQLEA